eukprot:8552243-Pyramimonas_sp.AAC.1
MSYHQPPPVGLGHDQRPRKAVFLVSIQRIPRMAAHTQHGPTLQFSGTDVRADVFCYKLINFSNASQPPSGHIAAIIGWFCRITLLPPTAQGTGVCVGGFRQRGMEQ